MAQAVIGAMGTLLPKLADLITKEYNLQRGVTGEIMFLKAEMESMETSLLRISEAPIDQPPDIQVKIWAKAVRDLSYGLEDSINKFMVRIETDGRPDKSHSFRNFIDKSLSLLTKGKIRHKIGINIKDIKSRIKEVSDRSDRYKVDNVAAAKPVGPAIDTLRLVAFIEVIKMLTEGDEVSEKCLKVVYIVGFGGLGKTTLANAVYKKLRVQISIQKQNLQFDCAAFVSMYQNINEASWGKQQLISEIRTFLENKRYLIVIDDIWDKSVWENIKYALIENGYGSRVITTTRVLYVSLQAGGRLKPLSVVDSRKLFYQRIYEMENKSPPNQLVEVSERILKRCGGVPLAILAIGSLLSSEKGTTHTHEYWYKVYKSISLGLDNNHDDVNNMRRILSTRNEEVGNQLATVSLSHVRSLTVFTPAFMPRWMCSMSYLFFLSITLKTLGEEDLQVLGSIYSMFSVKSDTMESRFGRGAMQSLQTLKLDFQDVEDTLFQFGDFALGLENLPSLEDVCVTFNEDTSEKISSVENWVTNLPPLR
ncbi:hypothetical protein VPH35_041371 [Triticum aestivum]